MRRRKWVKQPPSVENARRKEKPACVFHNHRNARNVSRERLERLTKRRHCGFWRVVWRGAGGWCGEGEGEGGEWGGGMRDG